MSPAPISSNVPTSGVAVWVIPAVAALKLLMPTRFVRLSWGTDLGWSIGHPSCCY